MRDSHRGNSVVGYHDCKAWGGEKSSRSSSARFFVRLWRWLWHVIALEGSHRDKFTSCRDSEVTTAAIRRRRWAQLAEEAPAAAEKPRRARNSVSLFSLPWLSTFLLSSEVLFLRAAGIPGGFFFYHQQPHAWCAVLRGGMPGYVISRAMMIGKLMGSGERISTWV